MNSFALSTWLNWSKICSEPHLAKSLKLITVSLNESEHAPPSLIQPRRHLSLYPHRLWQNPSRQWNCIHHLNKSELMISELGKSNPIMDQWTCFLGPLCPIVHVCLPYQSMGGRGCVALKWKDDGRRMRRRKRPM